MRGVPREYVKVAASGRRRVQAFCGTCGTALYARAADMPGPVNIRAGILRQRDSLVPVRQIWRRSALPWIPADVPWRLLCSDEVAEAVRGFRDRLGDALDGPSPPDSSGPGTEAGEPSP